jgi:hypothetical protein
MITCSICGKTPSGRFYGDRCAKCRSLQTEPRVGRDVTVFQPGDRVVLVRADRPNCMATVRDAGSLNGNGKPRIRVPLRITDSGVDAYAPVTELQLVYRPGAAVTDDMLPGISWLLKDRTQTEVATMLGMPLSTLSGVAKRLNRSEREAG